MVPYRVRNPAESTKMTRMSTIYLTAICFVLLVGLQPATAQPIGIIPASGQPLPEITLPSLDGNVMTTDDLLGKPIVLHVFASW